MNHFDVNRAICYVFKLILNLNNFQAKLFNKNINELISEIKYRLSSQEEFNKQIEHIYIYRLKKCYESMDIEKQESLKVNYLMININNLVY